jgi:hypothetical protein
LRESTQLKGAPEDLMGWPIRRRGSHHGKEIAGIESALESSLSLDPVEDVSVRNGKPAAVFQRPISARPMQ